MYPPVFAYKAKTVAEVLGYQAKTARTASGHDEGQPVLDEFGSDGSAA